VPGDAGTGAFVRNVATGVMAVWARRVLAPAPRTPDGALGGGARQRRRGARPGAPRRRGFDDGRLPGPVASRSTTEPVPRVDPPGSEPARGPWPGVNRVVRWARRVRQAGDYAFEECTDSLVGGVLTGALLRTQAGSGTCTWCSPGLGATRSGSWGVSDRRPLAARAESSTSSPPGMVSVLQKAPSTTVRRPHRLDVGRRPASHDRPLPRPGFAAEGAGVLGRWMAAKPGLLYLRHFLTASGWILLPRALLGERLARRFHSSVGPC